MVVFEVMRQYVSEMYWGGFMLRLDKEIHGREAQDIVRRICNAQCNLIMLMRQGTEMIDDESTSERWSELVLDLLGPSISDSKDELDYKSIIKTFELLVKEPKQHFDVENTHLWWIKKTFELDEPLSKRTGKNDKTKIKVSFGENSEIQPVGDAELDSMKTLLAPYASLKKRRLEETESAPQETTSKKPNLTSEEDVLASYRNKNLFEVTEDDWVINQNLFKLLDQSEVIQGQLRDQKLVNLLVRIDQSPDPMESLETALDTDSHFAKFVDNMLEVVGAQKYEGEGTERRIVSCINDILVRNTNKITKLAKDAPLDED